MRDGIRRRGESYVVDVTVKGRRRTATSATRAEALTKKAELRAELLKEAATLPAQTWTLQQAFDTTRTTAWS